jgi:hypothetical protein
MVLGSYWKITVGPGLNDVLVSWLRLQTVRANAKANANANSMRATMAMSMKIQ